MHTDTIYIKLSHIRQLDQIHEANVDTATSLDSNVNRFLRLLNPIELKSGNTKIAAP